MGSSPPPLFFVMKKYKHKWTEDDDGRHCKLCGSSIHENNRAAYVERQIDGELIPVSHYPKCNPLNDSNGKDNS